MNEVPLQKVICKTSGLVYNKDSKLDASKLLVKHYLK